MNEAALVDYAYAKFQEEKYEEALEAFVLAYCKGYEKEWILENIYQCYMEGNQAEFQSAYARHTGNVNVAYEDCILDFIPYKEGAYYIFDKEEGAFRGVFSISELRDAEIEPLLKQMEFSAAVLEFDWNWNERKSFLTDAKERKLYVIAHDMKRCMSFWKIPELAEYFKNVRVFESYGAFQAFFHQNTATYLPQMIFGSKEQREELTRILEEEHKYRLTPEGRNTENVLLTIAIPTYNRGHLVLERLKTLRTMLYDAEIEIVISKNGMEHYQEEYNEVSRIQDARIQYFDHGKTLVFTENWRYAIGMAHGRYVLMVSDEDDVILQSLEHYLKLLATHPQLSLARAKSTFQGSYITKRRYGERGVHSFECMFLSQNYLSGLIIRREDFMQEDFAELERFSKNAFYAFYPHEWWCAVLSQKGDCVEEPVALILEGEAEFAEKKDEAMEEEKRKRGESILPAYAGYATYESRLKQFQGIVEFLHWMWKGEPSYSALGLFWTIRKTERLFILARQYNFEREQFEEWVDKFCWMAMDAIDEFDFEENHKARLLAELKNSCVRMLKQHEEWNAEIVEA